MPDDHAFGRTTGTLTDDINGDKAVNGGVALAIDAHDVNIFPLHVGFCLAELCDQLVWVRRLTHDEFRLQQGHSGHIAITQGIEPVFHMIATAITAVNVEVKLIIADTKGPDAGANIIRQADTGKQQQDDDEGECFVVSDALYEIVQTLEKRAK